MKAIDEIETPEELSKIIDNVEGQVYDLKNYLVELESAKEEQAEFDRKMQADIDSNRY